MHLKKNVLLINSLLTGLERFPFSAASARLAAASCNLAYGMTAGGVISGASRPRGWGVIMIDSCKGPQPHNLVKIIFLARLYQRLELGF